MEKKPVYELPGAKIWQDLQKMIHAQSQTKGFWDEINLVRVILLIQSEMSEALEAYRKNDISEMKFVELDKIFSEPFLNLLSTLTFFYLIIFYQLFWRSL